MVDEPNWYIVKQIYMIYKHQSYNFKNLENCKVTTYNQISWIITEKEISGIEKRRDVQQFSATYCASMIQLLDRNWGLNGNTSWVVMKHFTAL